MGWLTSAKNHLNPGAGEASVGYITASDVKDAFEDINDGIEAVGGFNVKEFGATGDGSTDDTAAINAAISAAGYGGTVRFPPGVYIVSAPLQPWRQQRWVGSHSAKYDPAEFPSTTCAIKAKATGFTGTSLISYNNAPGVTLESLALLGQGQSIGALDGVDMGSSMSGEKQWWFKGLTFSAFSGAAITGSLWVGDIRDCHVGRCGYGFRPTGSQKWVDVRIFGAQVYFCTNAALEFDTSSKCGAITIMGCRFERSGNTYGNPAAPANTFAPGIRIGNGNNIQIIGTVTDACTGPGLYLGTTDPAKIVYSVSVFGCEFIRDGGGNQSTSELPGVMLWGCSHVQFVGCTIGYGAHNDSGGSFLSPFYGIHLEGAAQCQVGYSRIEVATFANSIHLVGSANYGLALNLQPHNMLSVPVTSDVAQPATPVTGAMYWSTTDQRPRFWTGTKWVDALNSDGTFNPVLKPGLDLDGPTTTGKSLRFRAADVLRWVMSLRQSSQSSNFTLDRHDSSGNYVDTPLTVRAADGVPVLNGGWLELGTGALAIRIGSGSPEGVVTAPVGSLFLRTDGGAGTSLYVKQSGAGSTGWAGK